jgi:hypothetical protein
MSKSPIKSSMKLPKIHPLQLSPIKHQGPRARRTTINDLISAKTTTFFEENLQVALIAKVEETAILQSQILELQAGMVLQRIYCAQLHRQLNTKETKETKGKKGGRRFLNDGLARLLTSDDLYAAIKAHEEELEEEECAQAAKRDAKALYVQELAKWTKDEEEQKKRNEEGMLRWQVEVAEWTAERQRVKARKEKLKQLETTNPKPKKANFQEKSAPHPKMQKFSSTKDGDATSNEEEWEDVNEDEE